MSAPLRAAAVLIAPAIVFALAVAGVGAYGAQTSQHRAQVIALTDAMETAQQARSEALDARLQLARLIVHAEALGADARSVLAAGDLLAADALAALSDAGAALAEAMPPLRQVLGVPPAASSSIAGLAVRVVELDATGSRTRSDTATLQSAVYRLEETLAAAARTAASAGAAVRDANPKASPNALDALTSSLDAIAERLGAGALPVAELQAYFVAAGGVREEHVAAVAAEQAAADRSGGGGGSGSPDTRVPLRAEPCSVLQCPDPANPPVPVFTGGWIGTWGCPYDTIRTEQFTLANGQYWVYEPSSPGPYAAGVISTGFQWVALVHYCA